MPPNLRVALTLLSAVLIAGAIILIDNGRARDAGNAGDARSADIAATASERAAAPGAAARLAEKSARLEPAKDFADPTGFINAAPFSLRDFVGKKVVLIDFWTYSCVNCVRTLPYLEAWSEKYKNAGLVVVGVHTPEFGFEKDIANVQAAVKKFGVTYPVVLDSDYGTWRAYGNQYWPHEYLVDIDGFIAEDRIGEGGYADTEQEIQKLLAERSTVFALGVSVPSGTVNPNAPTPTTSLPLSPETYFGSNRNSSFGNGAPGVSGSGEYVLPRAFAGDSFYLGGAWDVEPEYAAASTTGATLSYSFRARRLYLVGAGRGGTPAIFKVLLDGKPIGPSAGADASHGLLRLSENRLYTVVDAPAWGAHRIDLILESGSAELYTFTFG